MGSDSIDSRCESIESDPIENANARPRWWSCRKARAARATAATTSFPMGYYRSSHSQLRWLDNP